MCTQKCFTVRSSGKNNWKAPAPEDSIRNESRSVWGLRRCPFCLLSNGFLRQDWVESGDKPAPWLGSAHIPTPPSPDVRSAVLCELQLDRGTWVGGSSLIYKGKNLSCVHGRDPGIKLGHHWLLLDSCEQKKDWKFKAKQKEPSQ